VYSCYLGAGTGVLISP